MVSTDEMPQATTKPNNICLKKDNNKYECNNPTYWIKYCHVPADMAIIEYAIIFTCIILMLPPVKYKILTN